RASAAPSRAAASVYSARSPELEPQKTQILSILPPRPRRERQEYPNQWVSRHLRRPNGRRWEGLLPHTPWVYRSGTHRHTREASMSYFDLPPILEKMLSVAENISDLNFSVGRPPQVEINGKLTPVDIKGLRTL